MNVIIRVDSSKVIGSGHIQRCLNLANNFSLFGIKSFFLCSNFSGNLNYLIKKKYPLKEIKSKLKIKKKYKPASKSIQLNDARLTINYAKKIKAKFVVLDSYLFNYIWQSKVFNFFKLIFVDDLNIKNKCNIYINQHYQKKNFDKTIFLNKLTKKFIGPKFLIINKDQIKTKSNSKKKKIFIYMGDVDTANYTGKIFKIIQNNKFENYNFQIILGKNFEKKTQLLKYKKKKNIQIIDKRLKSIWNKFNINNDIIICSGGLIGSEAMFLNAKFILICQNIYQFNNLPINKKFIFKNLSTISEQKLLSCISELSLTKRLKKNLTNNFITKKILKNV